ncbi:hypothetical protein CCYA_CCYA01G0370 [Cyanidiococcus yangmingshanensis]|nr:hypothetical protein CCYA_CCYA01G0370 [Cyanidiococcus yangmingshanensis]
MSLPLYNGLHRDQPQTCQLLCVSSASHRIKLGSGRMGSHRVDENGLGQVSFKPFAWCGMLSWLVAVVLGTRAALLRRLDLSKLSSDNFGLAYAVSQSPRASPAVVVAHTSLGTTAPASATLLVPGPDRLPAGPLAAMATASMWMRSRLTILLVLVPCTIGGWMLVEGLREFEKQKSNWRIAGSETAVADQGGK